MDLQGVLQMPRIFGGRETRELFLFSPPINLCACLNVDSSEQHIYGALGLIDNTVVLMPLIRKICTKLVSTESEAIHWTEHELLLGLSICL